MSDFSRFLVGFEYTATSDPRSLRVLFLSKMGRDGTREMGRVKWDARNGTREMGCAKWDARNGAREMGRAKWGARNGAREMGRAFLPAVSLCKTGNKVQLTTFEEKQNSL